MRRSATPLLRPPVPCLKATATVTRSESPDFDAGLAEEGSASPEAYAGSSDASARESVLCPETPEPSAETPAPCSGASAEGNDEPALSAEASAEATDASEQGTDGSESPKNRLEAPFASRRGGKMDKVSRNEAGDPAVMGGPALQPA